MRDDNLDSRLRELAKVLQLHFSDLGDIKMFQVLQLEYTRLYEPVMARLWNQPTLDIPVSHQVSEGVKVTFEFFFKPNYSDKLKI